ncbi:hypothetical protein [Maricaulis parjimensis]|uniref:hypothetical protein n=1 Tax=Maricaulis parjimensis TaxID=144023 RepID=UPI00193AB214|nr:hypothetical protein [Maricaulis parjimensis]
MNAEGEPVLTIFTLPSGSNDALNPLHCHASEPRFWLDAETEILVSGHLVAEEPRLILYARRGDRRELEAVWNGSVGHDYPLIGALFSLATLDLNDDGQAELLLTQAGFHGGPTHVLSRLAHGEWRHVLTVRGSSLLGEDRRTGFERVEGGLRLWGATASYPDACWQWEAGDPIEAFSLRADRCGHAAEEGTELGETVGMIIIAPPEESARLLAEAEEQLDQQGVSVSCDEVE